MEETKAELSNTVTAEIDRWLTKFPKEQKQSAVIPALMAVQKENGGWLTDALIAAVADYLNIPRVSVMEVATFYSLFDLKPVGRHKIYVCTNISCMLCGSDKIMRHLKNKLQIDVNQTTKDGNFTLKAVECLGACGGAPMMQIDERYYENLTTESVEQILSELE